MSIELLVMLGLFAALMATEIALVFWGPKGPKTRACLRDISFFASQVLAVILVVAAFSNA